MATICFCSWVMLLNNGQKNNFDVTVKLTFDLLHRDVIIVSCLCETLSLKLWLKRGFVRSEQEIPPCWSWDVVFRRQAANIMCPAAAAPGVEAEKKALINSLCLMERGCGIHLITFPAASALCVTRGVSCLSMKDSYRDSSQHKSSLSLNLSLSHALTEKHWARRQIFLSSLLAEQ